MKCWNVDILKCWNTEVLTCWIAKMIKKWSHKILNNEMLKRWNDEMRKCWLFSFPCLSQITGMTIYKWDYTIFCQVRKIWIGGKKQFSSQRAQPPTLQGAGSLRKCQPQWNNVVGSRYQLQSNTPKSGERSRITKGHPGPGHQEGPRWWSDQGTANKGKGRECSRGTGGEGSGGS